RSPWRLRRAWRAVCQRAATACSASRPDPRRRRGHPRRDAPQWPPRATMPPHSTSEPPMTADTDSIACAMPAQALRLTSFSHGGGCGCKIAPGVLSEILRSSAGGIVPKELLVGIETADDAAVYQLNDEQALIATTDFFMPISDDYAMGGRPILALALVAMPIDKLSVAQIGQVIQGGESVCRAAGIPIAGGHTIDSVEPIYGLVVMGLVHPKKVRRNSDAREGDVLILGKPVGVGVLSAALKKNQLDDAGYKRLIDTTTRLNTPGIALADMAAVHAITDVTGFGIAGHALEMARGAGLRAEVSWSKVPLLE